MCEQELYPSMDNQMVAGVVEVVVVLLQEDPRKET